MDTIFTFHMQLFSWPLKVAYHLNKILLNKIIGRIFLHEHRDPKARFGEDSLTHMVSKLAFESRKCSCSHVFMKHILYLLSVSAVSLSECQTHQSCLPVISYSPWWLKENIWFYFHLVALILAPTLHQQPGCRNRWVSGWRLLMKQYQQYLFLPLLRRMNT